MKIENLQQEDSEQLEEKTEKQIVAIINKEIDIFDILKLVSPGTPLRIAIDDIVRAHTGAIIAIMSQDLPALLDGGFKVNCNFTPQRLMELSKMDAGVILSEDLKRILYANVLLIPDPTIPTVETGTRHRAAERVAKQAKTLVIAVSERRSTVTLYYCDQRYVLQDSEEILRRSTENLQILEKQREIYDELMTNLNVLEITGLVSISDVCSILQRTEMILRISEIVKRSIVELGREGSIVKMRLRELMRNIDKNEQFILKDYSSKPEKMKEMVLEISFDDLIDTSEMSRLLFGKSGDETIQPKGYRLLNKLNIHEDDIERFVAEFQNLNNLFNLSDEELLKVIKDEEFVQEFKKRLANLKENIMVGKKI